MGSSILKIQFSLALLLAAAVSLANSALAAPRTYAVLSLAGNSVTTVLERENTGSKLDQNYRTVMAIAEPLFDEAFIHGANTAIKQKQPDAKTVLLLTADQELYKAQNDMFDAAASNADNRTYLKSLLTNRGATHLVLVTKAHGEAEVRIGHDRIGKGRLEGLGFYMNNGVEILNTESLDRGRGVLAPYVYVKVRLIDAASMAVLHEEVLRQVIPIGNYEPGKDQAAWNTLSSKDKVVYLQEAIKTAMEEVVPKVLD